MVTIDVTDSKMVVLQIYKRIRISSADGLFVSLKWQDWFEYEYTSVLRNTD